MVPSPARLQGMGTSVDYVNNQAKHHAAGSLIATLERIEGK